MSENNLVPKKPSLPAVIKKNEEEQTFALVNYEKIDSSLYSFTCSFDAGFDFRMDESEKYADDTVDVESEFEDSVPEDEKIYYAAAAASGVLTGAIGRFHLTENQLKKIDEYKEKEWKPLILKAAELAGYKKKDYNGASKYLFDRAVKAVEKNDKTKECLVALAEQPDLSGLMFSILTQYEIMRISVNQKGDIKKAKLPSYYYIGRTNGEKIVSGVFYWLFEVAAKAASSEKRRIIDDLGISKDVIKKIKEFANFSFMKKIPQNHAAAEEAFSGWLKKTVDGANLYTEGKLNDSKFHPLFKMMGQVLRIGEQFFTVAINECLVRSLYMLLRFCSVVKERRISSFEELSEVPATEFLPSDNRILSKMCLIASATFAGINIACATAKAIKNQKAGGKKFAETLIAELNIVGIGRFVFACKDDSKYWSEDIHVFLQRKNKNQRQSANVNFEFSDNGAFETLVLNAEQARILYCMESISVIYDIEHTRDADAVNNKRLWLDTWKKLILSENELEPEMASTYFVEDENVLYEGLNRLSREKDNAKWIYLLTQEFTLFKPYSSLGSDEDKKFKKLKVESDYVKDQFVRRQTVVSQSEVDSIAKSYSKYMNYVSGSSQNKILGVGAAAVAAVATGGVAMTFAPGIAVALAGEAVAGLHGAALTSASLAFVGGGSIAAGGLGMAGGTAIITGGGALLGLAGSGTISAATVMLQTPSEYWVRQSSKLLTYCRCVLVNVFNDKISVNKIVQQLGIAITNTDTELSVIKLDKNDLDKEIIKKTEEYLKYLKKCEAELKKISK